MYDQNYRGRSGGRGGGRSNRGRGRYNQDQSSTGRGNQSTDQINKICTFHARNKSCQYGESCRFGHSISISAVIKAHENPVSAVGVLATPFRILTGSTDTGIKVWNLEGEVPREEVKIPTKGPVQRLEVVANTILWSSQEMSVTDVVDSSVGVVNFLIDTANLSSIPIKRSETLPYTHPMEVGYFTTALLNGTLFVITGGGDTTIRIWKFDQAKSSFEQLSVLEGHVRSITSLVVSDSKLWSASMDSMIRIWDLQNGTCDKAISAVNDGHKSAVCCLKAIPPIPPVNQQFIASGGCDGNLKIWKLDGTCVFTLPIGEVFVTALEVFIDEMGGQPMLLGGLSDGRISIIACSTMTIIHVIDAVICSTTAVNSIISIGGSKFLSAGDDGQLIIWQTDKPLIAPTA